MRVSKEFTNIKNMFLIMCENISNAYVEENKSKKYAWTSIQRE